MNIYTFIALALHEYQKHSKNTWQALASRLICWPMTKLQNSFQQQLFAGRIRDIYCLWSVRHTQFHSNRRLKYESILN